MGWFNNRVLLNDAGSCSAPHPLLFPACGFQEQFSTSGLCYPCAKGAQDGHETIPRSEEECAAVGFMQEKGQLRWKPTRQRCQRGKGSEAGLAKSSALQPVRQEVRQCLKRRAASVVAHNISRLYINI